MLVSSSSLTHYCEILKFKFKTGLYFTENKKN
jgi:hypothetical protein